MLCPCAYTSSRTKFRKSAKSGWGRINILRQYDAMPPRVGCRQGCPRSGDTVLAGVVIACGTYGPDSPTRYPAPVPPPITTCRARQIAGVMGRSQGRRRQMICGARVTGHVGARRSLRSDLHVAQSCLPSWWASCPMATRAAVRRPTARLCEMCGCVRGWLGFAEVSALFSISYMCVMVEPRGIEPLTSSLRTTRSPN